MSQPGKFLTAEWQSLAMLNYEIDPVVVRVARTPYMFSFLWMCRPDVPIIPLCTSEAIQLRVRRRHQELEHELLTGSSTVIRKSLQARGLPLQRYAGRIF